MYIWVLTGALGFVISIGVIIISSLIKSLTEKMNKMLEGIDSLNRLTTAQTEQIKALYDNKGETDRRLNDHGDRIRNIEIKCNKCKN